MATFPLSLFGFLPFVILMAAGAGTIVLLALGRIAIQDVLEIMDAVIVIVLGLTVVTIIVNLLCLNIRPVEHFEEGEKVKKTGNEFLDLLNQITLAERATCTLMTRADHFIQNDVGHEGIDDPTRITEAQQQARNTAGGPIVDCSAAAVEDISTNTMTILQTVATDESLNEAENRIARLETTLNSFTAPIFQKALNASNTCEGFALAKQPEFADIEGFAQGEQTTAKLKDLQKRLSSIQRVIETQKRSYLKPIDDKTAAMQRGEVSDCDRQKGGATGTAIAGSTG